MNTTSDPAVPRASRDEANLPPRSTLLQMFRLMALIKQNDEKLLQVIKSGRISVTYYSPRGQEAIPAALSVNLRREDYVVTIYRGIHDQLAKGVPLKHLWAEYAGRATGTCKGKGGPMHITHPDSGVMVTTGVVGSGLPIANGLAWASRLKGDGRVTIANFGDGASNIGAFHEALNLASLWKLPVIFVCQNNGYAEHTRYQDGTACASVAKRAAAYDMHGISVDGNDPVAMYNAAREAIERARAGSGPTLIEAHTFRFRGHLVGDDAKYIPEEELVAARQRDPYPNYRGLLIRMGHATEPELAGIEAEIEREITAAVEFAFESPFPSVDELRRDVYQQELPV
jgi:pyruvate dehydrogenase E1 component alpha subunit